MISDCTRSCKRAVRGRPTGAGQRCQLLLRQWDRDRSIHAGHDVGAGQFVQSAADALVGRREQRLEQVVGEAIDALRQRGDEHRVDGGMLGAEPIELGAMQRECLHRLQ